MICHKFKLNCCCCCCLRWMDLFRVLNSLCCYLHSLTNKYKNKNKLHYCAWHWTVHYSWSKWTVNCCHMGFPLSVSSRAYLLSLVDSIDSYYSLFHSFYVQESIITKLPEFGVLGIPRHPKQSDIDTQHTRRSLFCVYAMLFI